MCDCLGFQQALFSDDLRRELLQKPIINAELAYNSFIVDNYKSWRHNPRYPFKDQVQDNLVTMELLALDHPLCQFVPPLWKRNIQSFRNLNKSPQEGNLCHKISPLFLQYPQRAGLLVTCFLRLPECLQIFSFLRFLLTKSLQKGHHSYLSPRGFFNLRHRASI
ncbi:hypothetical protein L6452_43065 [Arctium lappa]|uniref:Uncharacterized protein n=1 Tax=Arctium lappa TaxID=4217 RepID=A0ACB8XKQ9_ARCLA|nr:hypothetical protein L6452_43065 [Arctium lappa]